jgi:hypothetical protein
LLGKDAFTLGRPCAGNKGQATLLSFEKKVTKKQALCTMVTSQNGGQTAQENGINVGPLYFLLLFILFPQNRYASGRG